jgi:hypothetical protein
MDGLASEEAASGRDSCREILREGFGRRWKRLAEIVLMKTKIEGRIEEKRGLQNQGISFQVNQTKGKYCPDFPLTFFCHTGPARKR